MDKTVLIEAIQRENDPYILGAVSKILLGGPDLPIYDPDTIEAVINRSKERGERGGYISLEESRKRVLGNR